MEIVTDLEELRKPTKPVGSREEAQQHAVILLDALHEYNAEGIAANQVGFPLRMFAMKQKKYAPICIVNPQITQATGTQERVESCLSLPGVTAMVARPQKITVKGFNMYLKPVTHRFAGLEARRACHEIDHLDGKLIIDGR